MGLMADSETWEAVLHGIYTEAHLSVNIHLRSLQRYFEWFAENPRGHVSMSLEAGALKWQGGSLRWTQ